MKEQLPEELSEFVTCAKLSVSSKGPQERVYYKLVAVRLYPVSLGREGLSTPVVGWRSWWGGGVGGVGGGVRGLYSCKE